MTSINISKSSSSSRTTNASNWTARRSKPAERNLCACVYELSRLFIEPQAAKLRQQANKGKIPKKSLPLQSWSNETKANCKIITHNFSTSEVGWTFPRLVCCLRLRTNWLSWFVDQQLWGSKESNRNLTQRWSRLEGRDLRKIFLVGTPA